MVLWFGLEEEINKLKSDMLWEKRQRIEQSEYLKAKVQAYCPHAKVEEQKVNFPSMMHRDGARTVHSVHYYKCEICEKVFTEKPEGSKIKTVVYK
jgi:predicted restriction endonuclease